MSRNQSIKQSKEADNQDKRSENQSKNGNDLGKDSLGSLLFRLALPSILAQLINALYNIVDRMYIGHIDQVGAVALTGVGVAFPIIIIISAFSALVGMGGAPRAAICMGAGDDDGAEEILGNSFVVLIGMAAVLTVFFEILKEPMLLAFGASAQTVSYGTDYLGIYILGTVFVQISLGLNSFINTQGFAKTGMYTVVIGAIINIILDPIFIFGFDMGVKGAALATIIAQAVSALWVLKFLFGSKTRLKIRKKYFKLNKKILISVLALGVSPFIMQSTESFVTIALNMNLQRYGGDLAVGAMTICGSLMQVLSMPFTGLAQGAQPIISFNYGAKNRERVKKTFSLLIKSSLCYSICIWAAVMLAPNLFVSLFNDDPELVGMAVWSLRIYLAALCVLGVQFSCQQTFVALGEAKLSVFLALLRKVILLIPFIFLFPMFLQDKVFAVFLAEPAADIMAATATGTIFAFRFRKILKGL